ncbi:MAG: hypothetical protein ABIG35_11560 [Pseudomonadota bacterium]
MSGADRAEYSTISLLFELDRNDNPWLYDDLIRFKKGTKRINRLRFLAHEGMVAQLASVGVAAGMTRPNIAMLAPVTTSAEATPTVVLPMAGDIFAEPIAD